LFCISNPHQEQFNSNDKNETTKKTAEKLWLNFEMKFLYFKKQSVYNEIKKLENQYLVNHFYNNFFSLKNHI